MACAAPVIASDIGGVPEVVRRSGANGFLVPPGDLPALEDAMRTLARDEGLRRQVGNAARERVLAEYTVERMVEQTLEVYRVAIARRRPALARSRTPASPC
jgi:starch synthase